MEEAKGHLKLKNNEEMWFRGVSKKSHALRPSLFRCFKEEIPEAEDIRDLESDLFFEFQAKARFTDGVGVSDWDVLFLMQHYRAPTRLLDWTEVLHVAMYFAIAYRKSEEFEPARIYVMNPYLWNRKHGYSRDLYSPRNFSWDENEEEYYEYGEILVDGAYIDWKYPCALYPPQRDVRLSAQKGYFTIHGSDVRPLEQISPEILLAVDLDAEAVRDCTKQLEFSGLDEFSLFPDLEGLSRKLRRKYKCP
jgi:FRG domain